MGNFIQLLKKLKIVLFVFSLLTIAFYFIFDFRCSNFLNCQNITITESTSGGINETNKETESTGPKKPESEEDGKKQKPPSLNLSFDSPIKDNLRKELLKQKIRALQVSATGLCGDPKKNQIEINIYFDQKASDYYLSVKVLCNNQVLIDRRDVIAKVGINDAFKFLMDQAITEIYGLQKGKGSSDDVKNRVPNNYE